MPDMWLDVDTSLAEVPVNIAPLIDDTDFKTRETSVAYNATGMDLVWNFITTGGAFTQTAVTPTSGGNYDWTNQGDGMYSIEIPASGGASINNDTEGVGWFTGLATGVLPWRGPTIGFRAAALNDALIDSAWSATRGLAGTALPDAAAEAAGGLYTRGTGAGQIGQTTNGTVNVLLTAAGVAAIWDALVAGITTANSIGKRIVDYLTGDAYAIVNSGTHGNAALKTLIDTVDTVVDAVKAKTDNLPTDPADASDVAAAIAALNDLSAAEVNAEVVDALATDTYTEVTGVPAYPAAVTTMIRRLYAALINPVAVTATKKTFKNAAGTAQWEKDLADDGTTYTESEGNAP